MASPQRVIETLSQRGVILRALPDGKLHIKGTNKLTPTERAVIRSHKGALLKAIEPPSTIAREYLETIHPGLIEGIPLNILLDEAHESDYPDLLSLDTLKAFARSCLWTGTIDPQKVGGGQ